MAIVIRGGQDDQITTGSASDVILAGGGHNTVDAGDGNNTVTAGAGNDDITTGSGNDTINAGNGNNTIDAGDGNNAVTTGSGNDEVVGGSGNDAVSTGGGEDTVSLGAGDNSAHLGGGNDTVNFVWSEGAGHRNAFYGQGGEDRLRITLTADQAQNAAVLADLAAFQAHLATGSDDPFQFSAIDLAVADFESVELIAPVLAADDTAGVAEDGPPVVIAVLANDTDLLAADNSALSVTDFDDSGVPAGASLVLNADNTFSFDPGTAFQHLAAGEEAQVEFTYTVADDQGFEATATATVTVTGANDDPEITQLAGPSAANPILVAENTTGSFLTVTATDAESQTLTYSIGDNPDGSYDNTFFTVDPNTGELSFTNPPDFEFDDPGGDDLYKVQVTVTDTQGGTATRDYFVQVTDVAEGIQVQNVGYYEMSVGSGQDSQKTPIIDAGLTAVDLDVLTPEALDGVDALFVTNANNSGYGAEFTNALPDIFDFVADGGVLVIHDRHVENAESILPGLAGANIIRDFNEHTQIEFVNDSGEIANGPGGNLTDASLDNGGSSHHGFAITGSLPAGVELIHTTNNPDHTVTLAYKYGEGLVVFSSIPLDFYLAGFGSPTLDANMTDYATNLMAWIKNGADFAVA